jgi:hypothetical protein
MSYALTLDKGQALAVPNVCKVQVGLAKVPLPLVNISKLQSGKTSIKIVQIMSKPPYVVGDKIPKSNGDEVSMPAGGGVISGKATGETCWMMGSMVLFMKGKPALSMVAPTMQNNNNMIGKIMSNKQKKVQIKR